VCGCMCMYNFTFIVSVYMCVCGGGGTYVCALLHLYMYVCVGEMYVCVYISCHTSILPVYLCARETDVSLYIYIHIMSYRPSDRNSTHTWHIELVRHITIHMHTCHVFSGNEIVYIVSMCYF
jgi:hypothetical protein